MIVEKLGEMTCDLCNSRQAESVYAIAENYSCKEKKESLKDAGAARAARIAEVI
jgi:hypothetical protein